MPSNKKATGVAPKKVEPFDQPSTLMMKTVELLQKRDLFEVYSETKISFYWLRKFVALDFKNPSVNRVQYLYEHLTGTELV